MADLILIPDTTTELRPMSRRCGRTLGGRDPLDQWQGVGTTPRSPPTKPSATPPASTTSPPCPWPPVTSRRVG
jgi:hypothetical protein